MLTGKHSKSFSLGRSNSLMDFFAVSFADVEMRSFCLLTSMELILIPN